MLQSQAARAQLAACVEPTNDGMHPKASYVLTHQALEAASCGQQPPSRRPAAAKQHPTPACMRADVCSSSGASYATRSCDWVCPARSRQQHAGTRIICMPGQTAATFKPPCQANEQQAVHWDATALACAAAAAMTAAIANHQPSVLVLVGLSPAGLEEACASAAAFCLATCAAASAPQQAEQRAAGLHQTHLTCC